MHSYACPCNAARKKALLVCLSCRHDAGDSAGHLYRGRQHRDSPSQSVQLCDFLGASTEVPCDVFWQALWTEWQCVPEDVVQYALTAPSADAAQVDVDADVLRQSMRALALLRQQPPYLANLVLAAPSAHITRSTISLAAVLAALPHTLHAAAVRGFFGVSTGHWCVTSSNEECLRVVQLLPEQRYVHAATLLGGGAMMPRATRLLTYATHLDYLTVHLQSPGELACITPLTSLRALTNLELYCPYCPRGLVDELSSVQLVLRAQLQLKRCVLVDVLQPAHHQCAELLECLAGRTTLTELRLVGVGEGSAFAVARMLGAMPRLRTLAIRLDCQLRTNWERDSSVMVAQMAAFMEGVSLCTGLTELTLCDNMTLQTLDACMLSPQLTVLSALRQLSYETTRVLSASCLRLLSCESAVALLAGLTALELGSCTMQLEDESHGAACGRHVTSSPLLQQLRTPSVLCSAAAACAFLSAMAQRTSLTSLKVCLDLQSAAQPGHAGLAASPAALRDLKTLSLRTQGANSRHEIASAVLEACTSLPRLTELQLHAFELNQTRATASAPHFAALTRLLVLDLSGNAACRMAERRRVGTVAVLAPHLAALRGLTKLDIRDCALRPSDAEFVAAAVSKLPELRVLRCRHNNFCDVATVFAPTPAAKARGLQLE